MDAIYQLNFLQEKIENIGNAIFHNLSNAVLKLPTSIVSTIKVDDYGFVWFYAEKRNEHLNEFEQEFPVKLDFYKKGMGFLQVTGKAFVVTDPEEMNSFVDLPEGLKKPANNMALVKVKIMKAEYFETKATQKQAWWQSAWNTFSAWFRHNPYRADNTYYPAS